ncbi:MAG: hypothetical protein JNK25_06615 [Phycisphaerae bacterium]|nr:hypothetical protein [Phycisphaerae bacterium]
MVRRSWQIQRVRLFRPRENSWYEHPAPTPRLCFRPAVPAYGGDAVLADRFVHMIRVNVLAGDGEPDTIADNVKSAVEALVTSSESPAERTRVD